MLKSVYSCTVYNLYLFFRFVVVFVVSVFYCCFCGALYFDPTRNICATVLYVCYIFLEYEKKNSPSFQNFLFFYSLFIDVAMIRASIVPISISASLRLVDLLCAHLNDHII